jgi:hypothetical protein
MEIPNTDVKIGKLYRHHIFSHKLYKPISIQGDDVICLHNKNADYSLHKWNNFSHQESIPVSKFLSGEYVKTFEKAKHILYQSFDNFNLAGCIVVFDSGKGVLNHLPFEYCDPKDDHTCYEFQLTLDEMIGMKLKYTVFGWFRYNSDIHNAKTIFEYCVKPEYFPVNYRLDQFKETYTTGVLQSERRKVLGGAHEKKYKPLFLPHEQKHAVQQSLF